MKPTMTLVAMAVLFAAAACKQHGDEAQRKTKFPGMVTAALALAAGEIGRAHV